MAVTFKMPHTVGTLYNLGETAGFSKEIEADLIKREIAEKAKVAPVEKPAAPAA